MREAMYEIAVDNPELRLILSGGIYDYEEISQISRQTTPAAFNSDRELQPCCLMKVSGPVSSADPYVNAARVTIEFYLYESYGYQNTRAAREMLFDLFHDRKVLPKRDGVGCWSLKWVADVTGEEDPNLSGAYGNASMELSRFEAIVNRR